MCIKCKIHIVTKMDQITLMDENFIAQYTDLNYKSGRVLINWS